MLWRRVHGGLRTPSFGSSHCSMPVISVATVWPFLNHCLKFFDSFSSSCSQLVSKAAG
ncbi:hypothetical protein D3C80_1973660 [compost metagenome]